MIRNDSGATGFYPNFIGIPLIRRALKTGSPEEAIRWLEKVLATSSATGKVVAVLWGAPVVSAIQLTAEVAIVPLAELPESAQKQWIVDHSSLGTGSPATSMLEFSPPQSALLVSRRIEPLTYDPTEQPELKDDRVFLQTDEFLREVTLALTVVGLRVPILAAQWFTFNDPDFETAGLGAFTRSHLLEILPNRPSDYPVLDPTEARNIVEAYLALTKPTRNTVRLALERLNQAQRRHRIGDRAVDLSIAFETLLLRRRSSDRVENITKRLEHFLDGSRAIRKKNSDVINATYGIRSDLVHAGQDAVGHRWIDGHRMSVLDIIEHATAMCAELVRTVMRRGSLPKW